MLRGRARPVGVFATGALGTSGHCGSSFDLSCNEQHVQAISQAICDHRQAQHIDGPLFLGLDTHALSQPACANALEVLAADGVNMGLAVGDEYTSAPAISHAIPTHSRGQSSGLADGIAITPSHNPPESGGFKYSPANVGLAGTDITAGLEAAANRHLQTKLRGVKRARHAQALRASTTHRQDFLSSCVADLGNLINLAALRKTVVSTRMIDRVAARAGRALCEVAVGFKRFSVGLPDGSLGFGGEESAGASAAGRRDHRALRARPGTAWCRTGERTWRAKRRPHRSAGDPSTKKQLAALAPASIQARGLAAETITVVFDRAPGNGLAIGGIKVTTENGWFAARPSSTLDIYKIHAERFKRNEHLQRVLREAQATLDRARATP